MSHLPLCLGLSLALSFAPLLPLAPAPAKFEWQSSYEAALKTAASEQRVVFVAVDHAGEGRSERFLKKLIKDKRVVELAQRTLNVPASLLSHKKSGACPRFKGLDCSDHRRAEASLRESVLLENDVGMVAAPQYVWLDGGGEVLLSVAYELDRDGLVWCFEMAERLLHTETEVALSPEARPPRRLLMGRTFRPLPGDSMARGLTAEELEAALGATKKSFMGMANRGRTAQVMFTDEEEAVEYIKVELSGVLKLFARDNLDRTIHALGSLSPAPFWEALEDFEKEDDPAVRQEVAVALEQMGASDALRMAKAALKREKDERVRPAFARALGACGATDKSTRKTLLKLTDEQQSAEMQASAAFALGYLQRHEDVRSRWHELFAGTLPDLQLAAACGAALARDAACLPAIEELAGRSDGEHKAALERTLAVLRGGDLYPIEDDVMRVTRDVVRRDRVFFGGPLGENGESEEDEDSKSGPGQPCASPSRR